MRPVRRRTKEDPADAVTSPPYLGFDDITSTGLLQEINRTILHPLGLAAEVRLDGSLFIQDHRSDPEGVMYDEVDASKAAAYAEMWTRRVADRTKRLGWVIQPVGEAGRASLARSMMRGVKL